MKSVQGNILKCRWFRSATVISIFAVYICMILCSCSQDSMDSSVTDKNDIIQSLQDNQEFSNAVKSEELSSLRIDLPLKESRVISLSLNSKYLNRRTPFNVYLPKGYGDGEDYPVWYGLHGSGSDESMWLNQVNAAEVCDELTAKGEIKPIIMVFPYVRDDSIKDIQANIGDDGKIGERFADQYICRELVPYIDSKFDTVSSPDGRYIGGFSMGGMISLRVAFHHSDIFSKVGGYSAAVISSDYSDRQLEKWLFPNENTDEIADVASFAKGKGMDKLSVYLDCGTNNDPFLNGIQSIYEALQKRGIKSELHMYKGGHDLDHARVEIGEYLKFYVGEN